MTEADFIVVGGGVAGLSAAAALAMHGRVVVLEAEEALGFHASGRSATFSHYGIGNDAVRALTAWSRDRFAPGVARRAQALFFATEEMLPKLAELEARMSRFTDSLERVGEARMTELFPPLRTGPGAAVAGLHYPDGLRLDSDAMLQGYARTIRRGGGHVLTGRRITRAEPGWTVAAATGET